MEVTIVEDDTMLLGLLSERLDSYPDVHVSSNFRSCGEYLRRMPSLAHDVLVSDVRLPDGTGLEIGVRTKRLRADVAVVLISAFDVPGLFHQIPEDVRSGWAFVDKQSVSAIDDLLDAFEVTRRGGLLLPSKSSNGVESLTLRERDILHRLGRGDSNRAIADELSLSVKTVETMLSVIYQKLGLRNDEPTLNQRVLASRIAASLVI